MGINPLDIHFILSLIAMITITARLVLLGLVVSATFAALIVLPAMGLPRDNRNTAYLD
ncbi:hypothetical protein ACT691_02560 [Vibrio metschnikovii]